MALVQQNSSGLSGGFSETPPGATICGFGVPSLAFSFGLHVPKFPPFPIPPTFDFFVGFNCSLSNPLSASFGFGGGRVSAQDPDADPDYTADL
jgi:hypothetical protein